MQLAKQCLDIGVFTDNLDRMREFYGARVKLPFEAKLPLGSGIDQYRYGLLGSVLKINHSPGPLSSHSSGGYGKITIADPHTSAPLELSDPDGNRIELVPSGHNGVTQVAVNVGVTDEGEFDRFYGEVLGCERLGEGRYRLGQTILSVERDQSARRSKPATVATLKDALGAMGGRGIRYVTIHVRDCDAAHRRLMSMGVSEGAPPIAFGDIARVCFIHDPDGNWIEIAQRASLAGPVPKR